MTIPTLELDSLGLAEQYVQEQIHLYLLECEADEFQLRFGDKVEVTNMEQCDCIPVRVHVGETHWRVQKVERGGWGRILIATYECVKVKR